MAFDNVILVLIPEQRDGVFQRWAKKGLLTFNDFYVDNDLACFSQLRDQFRLPNGQFFHHTKATNYIKQSLAQSDIKSPVGGFIQFKM